MILSYLGGINVAFFAYNLGLKHMKKYIGIPLTFVLFFETRNILMKNFMNKIYFPIQPLYLQLRDQEKLIKAK